jgi:hypothetical protein
MEAESSLFCHKSILINFILSQFNPFHIIKTYFSTVKFKPLVAKPQATAYAKITTLFHKDRMRHLYQEAKC